MNIHEITDKLNGIQTIESIKSSLQVKKSRAIYIVHKLRKKGYVQTKQDSNNKRIYFISRSNALGGTSYLDILNKYSPVKLYSSEIHRIYGRDISIEETIIYAIKTRKSRYILSSLALFKRIEDWKRLYHIARKNNVVREVGVLYGMVEHNFPRIKKMSKYYKRYGLPKDKDKFIYVIPKFKSKDFCNMEKKWKTYIPFNKEDLEDYGI